jgi:hypothetical protein
MNITSMSIVYMSTHKTACVKGPIHMALIAGLAARLAAALGNGNKDLVNIT